MARLVALLAVSILFAAPATAQVINGETPLDETPLDRQMPGPAAQTPPSAARSSSDVAEPTYRHLPPTARPRD